MSSVVGANLEFELNYKESKMNFSFLYDVKDRLADFSISGDSNHTKELNKIFTSLVGKNRFDLNKTFLSSSAISHNLFLSIITKILFEFNPSYCEFSRNDQTSLENLICRCFGINELEIRNVIDKGATDLATITNLTKACGGCASCAGDIRLILKEKINSSFIPLLTEEEENELNITQTTLAKIKREKIMGLWPIDFLKDHIIPMSKLYNFEVASLVENTLYVKSHGVVPELEDFIKSNNLSLVTFYI